MTPGGRPLSLAHLSLLHLPPAELVRVAAGAGFDLVGALRLNPSSSGSGHDLLGSAQLLEETVQALDDTGLPVLDVEVFRLRPGTRAVEAEPWLDVGGRLGARFLLCTVEDPEPARAAAEVAALVGLAATYGLRIVVEPMLFSAVRTPAQALAQLHLADLPGAGVLVDALHLVRAGGTPADLRDVDPALLPYAQVCDAATAGPAADPAAAAHEAVTERLAPGDGVLPLRALLAALAPTAPVSVEAPHPAGREDAARWARHLLVRARELVVDSPSADVFL